MSDVKQLPPLVMKSISDGSNPNTSVEFMNPPNQLETVNFTFHMIDVIKQKDGNFKDILSFMRNGTLMIENCRYLINCCLSNIDKNKKIFFDKAIYLIPQ